MLTILATGGIYSDHNHSCLHSPSSQHRPGTQETVWEYKWDVTGDFNKANFRTIAPEYFQHITINMHGVRALDHCYSPFRDAYKSLPYPTFVKSDNSSLLLLPACRQKLKRETPALRTIQCWSDQSDAILQDCFDHVDWDMFRTASDDDIEAYSDTITCLEGETMGFCSTNKNNPHLPHPKTVDYQHCSSSLVSADICL